MSEKYFGFHGESNLSWFVGQKRLLSDHGVPLASWSGSLPSPILIGPSECFARPDTSKHIETYNMKLTIRLFHQDLRGWWHPIGGTHPIHTTGGTIWLAPGEATVSSHWSHNVQRKARLPHLNDEIWVGPKNVLLLACCEKFQRF